jgi:hypothetical protein
MMNIVGSFAAPVLDRGVDRRSSQGLWRCPSLVSHQLPHGHPDADCGRVAVVTELQVFGTTESSACTVSSSFDRGTRRPSENIIGPASSLADQLWEDCDDLARDGSNSQGHGMEDSTSHSSSTSTHTAEIIAVTVAAPGLSMGTGRTIAREHGSGAERRARTVSSGVGLWTRGPSESSACKVGLIVFLQKAEHCPTHSHRTEALEK